MSPEAQLKHDLAEVDRLQAIMLKLNYTSEGTATLTSAQARLLEDKRYDAHGTFARRTVSKPMRSQGEIYAGHD